MNHEPTRSFARSHLPQLFLAALAVPVLVAWGGWVLWAGVAADRVTASWKLDCPGTRLESFEGDPAVRSVPGWRCDLHLRVANQGSRDVRVTQVKTPFLGRGGGGEVRGFSTDDAEIRDAGAPRGGPLRGVREVDAVYDVDTVVPGRSSRTVTLAIGWRERGCNGAGHVWFDNWPTVVFEALHRTHERPPDQRMVLRTFDDAHDRRVCGG